jgi:hypothetical protein
MKKMLAALILAVAATLGVSAQITRDDNPLKITVSSTNGAGDNLLCPRCSGRFLVEGAPLDPARPLVFKAGGIQIQPFNVGAIGLIAELPADFPTSARPETYITVLAEITQDGRYYTGYFRVTHSSPKIAVYASGTPSGLWGYEGTGGFAFLNQQPVRIGPLSTTVIINTVNLGNYYTNPATNQIRVYVGSLALIGTVQYVFFPGTYDVGFTIPGGALPPGCHAISVLGIGGRLSPPTGCVNFAIPLNQ